MIVSKRWSNKAPFSIGSALAWLALAAAPAAGAVEPIALVRAAIELACNAKSIADLDALPRRLPGVEGARAQSTIIKLLSGRRRRINLPDGLLTLDWIAPREQLYHISVQYDGAGGERPEVFAVVDFRCELRAARRLYYDADGKPAWLEPLGAGLQPSGEREPLNPPVPAQPDPSGVPVALIDTGVNYLLPEINTRLARDVAGELLGYDYWDMDARPFDAHPVRSAFYPERHGTQIASLLLAEAPVAKLLPYRYPRPAMERMATLIEAAAAQGVKLANLALVSPHADDWLAFEQAARRHPEMLFVVAAGNKRHNLDQWPMYPAAFELDNLLTVTAATAGGSLAYGVNWGPRSVDLMVPAEEILVTDYDGRRLRVSGSSYATARVTALAACLLAENPAWQAPELKKAIFALAQTPKTDDWVAVGFIPDALLAGRGACKTAVRQPPVKRYCNCAL